MALLLQKFYLHTENLFENQSCYAYHDLMDYNRTYLETLKCYFNSYLEEPNEVTIKAERGALMVSQLPDNFKAINSGKFIAMTFSGKILAIRENLKDLNEQLAKIDVMENYYIERIGFGIMTQI